MPTHLPERTNTFASLHLREARAMRRISLLTNRNINPNPHFGVAESSPSALSKGELRIITGTLAFGKCFSHSALGPNWRGLRGSARYSPVNHSGRLLIRWKQMSGKLGSPARGSQDQAARLSPETPSSVKAPKNNSLQDTELGRLLIRWKQMSGKLGSPARGSQDQAARLSPETPSSVKAPKNNSLQDT